MGKLGGRYAFHGKCWCKRCRNQGGSHGYDPKCPCDACRDPTRWAKLLGEHRDAPRHEVVALSRYAGKIGLGGTVVKDESGALTWEGEALGRSEAAARATLRELAQERGALWRERLRSSAARTSLLTDGAR